MPNQRFLSIVPEVLSHEGGYNKMSPDSGASISWGVSLRFLKSIEQAVEWTDISALSRDEATELYRLNYWKPIYDLLPAKIDAKVFDVAVGALDHQAHMLLQKSLNALGSRLKVDGLIGKVTIAECEKYIEGNILATYVKEQEAFYRGLVAKDPTQKKFLNGWLNRA